MATCPHRTRARSDKPGRNRTAKSVVTAVAAEFRFADSVDTVAANSAATTSPARHGGNSVAMNTGNTESHFGIVTSIIAGFVR